MQIHLPAELETQIRADVQRGSYASVDDFVAHAIGILHEQEEWLASNRSEIAGKIEEGWNAANRGELSSEEEVRSKMTERKRDWLDQQQRVA